MVEAKQLRIHILSTQGLLGSAAPWSQGPTGRDTPTSTLCPEWFSGGTCFLSQQLPNLASQGWAMGRPWKESQDQETGNCLKLVVRAVSDRCHRFPLTLKILRWASESSLPAVPGNWNKGTESQYRPRSPEPKPPATELTPKGSHLIPLFLVLRTQSWPAGYH